MILKKLNLGKKDETPRKTLLKQLRKNRQEEETEDDQDKIKFISSGSDNLNLALTGNIEKGYPIGRFITIKGDSSVGKTLMVIEAINQVWYKEKAKGKSVKIRYNDAEAAFDYDFGERLGMPINDVEWTDSDTIEDFHYDLFKFIKDNSNEDVIVYVLDSLDSIGDKAEQKFIDDIMKETEKKKQREEEGEEVKEDKDKGTYGMAKAKLLSRFFRDLARKIKKTNCLLIIISQIRDNPNARYGKKTKISGGRALKFYASQIIDLSKTGKLFKNKSSAIPYGVNVEALVEKNKVYPEGREAKFDVIFNHGVENYGSLIDFCKEYKSIKKSGAYLIWNNENMYRENLIKLFEDNPNEYKKLKKLAQQTWNNLEENCRVERKRKWN